MTANALVVDDEVDLCRLMQMTLTKMGINSDVAYDIATARQHLANKEYSFCLTDMRLPDGSGLDLVKHISQNFSNMPVAVITAHGNMDIAIQALKLGAFDFVNKPLELPRLRQLIEHALKVSEENSESNELTDLSDTGDNSSVESPKKTNADLLLDKHLIGNSPVIASLKATIIKLARSQAPVFLWGESGTGKEVVAKMIHELSPRRESNFVAVNCGAIPSELMESEFFGHKKGSFTGATTDKIGLFQQADGGTLFLDEVADLPLAMQVKLLRAIQEKSVRAIGDTKEVPVDIRILSATHKDLNKLVQQGEFRQDLFYRINVIELKLPTLNERGNDIDLLADYFLQEIADEWQLEESISLSDCAHESLRQHRYEGNVRELRNLLERAVTLADSNLITASQLGLTNKAVAQDNETTNLALVSSRDVSYSGDEDSGDEDSGGGGSGNEETLQKSIDESNSHAHSQQLQAQSSHTASVESDLTSVLPDNQTLSAHAHVIHPASDNSLQNTLVSTNIKLPLNLDSIATTSQQQALPKEGLEGYLQNQERELIIIALNKTNWNKTKAAKLLGTSFRSLRYRMKKLEIENDENDE